ncbi:hypothetical protein [Streptomyces sp. RG80]|uniref:hypothetical protein n=1 Tax=Streptomyces sp. RG80 TaxID=3157340 RepID=UPI00338E56E7
MTAIATPDRDSTSVGYQVLKVTELWSFAEELFAIDVDGHVPARVALAAANRYAREVWGFLSLARECRNKSWALGYVPTGCQRLYVRTPVCLIKPCSCEGFGHPQDSAVPLPGARPVTRIDFC